MSAFGGVIAANGTVTKEMAAQVAEIFTEVIIAPDFEPGALEILTAKKNQRLLARARRRPRAPAALDWRQVSGGTADADRRYRRRAGRLRRELAAGGRRSR